MKHIVLNLLITVFIVFTAEAQKGFLRGTIIDASTGEPLIGATVAVAGTTTGTISDFDGNYNLPLEQGTYNIQISYISYETQNFPGVIIEAGGVEIINANLGEATTELNEVVVTAEARQRTEAAIQVMQRKSAVVLDGISSQQISRMGDSDAADALKRVTGVTVQGGKYVYIRGLSDRYMKVTLNGAEVPGLDPNFNTVQMDLFPSNVIENMMISKTFSPDQISFTGGLVDVQTKEFPSSFTLTASASWGFNTQAHFNDEFLTYQGGALDWLGIDDGARAIPDVIAGEESPEPLPNLATPEVVYDFSNKFNRIIAPEHSTAPLDQSYSLSLGNQYSFGAERSFGFITGLTYQNNSNYYKNGRLDDYDANSAFTAEANELRSEDRGNTEVIWSALLGASLKVNNNNRIRATYLHNQNGLSIARYLTGTTRTSDNYELFQTNLEYLQRSLSSAQLSGKHVLPFLNNATVEWLSSYTHSSQKEPDIRFFIAEIISLNGGEDTLYEVRSNRKPERRYRSMWEYNWHNRLDLNFPINVGESTLNLKIGGSYLDKYRDSDENRYAIEVIGTTPTDQFNNSGLPEIYVSDQNLFGYEQQLLGTFYNNDLFSDKVYSYIGKDVISATYAMVDFPLFEKLRIVTGVRVENTAMSIENKIDTTIFTRRSQIEAFLNSRGSSSETNYLPSLNITYSVSELMNLRFAISQSIARPSFRERAPYEYYEYTENTSILGNPDLNISTVQNIDIRWEYFFNPGELISVSGFYKYFNSPIERYKVSLTGALTTFRNGADARMYGAEIEFRKTLDFIRLLRDFQIGTNFTYIHSEQNVDSTRLALARKVVPDFPTIRPFYGQPPYIFNAFLIYNNTDMGLNANLAFNVEGEKIIILSKFQTPDVYEQPYPELNFNIGKKVFENFEISFSVENLLNPVFEQSFELDGEIYPYRRFTLGRKFAISLSYTFD